MWPIIFNAIIAASLPTSVHATCETTQEFSPPDFDHVASGLDSPYNQGQEANICMVLWPGKGCINTEDLVADDGSGDRANLAVITLPMDGSKPIAYSIPELGFGGFGTEQSIDSVVASVSLSRPLAIGEQLDLSTYARDSSGHSVGPNCGAASSILCGEAGPLSYLNDSQSPVRNCINCIEDWRLDYDCDGNPIFVTCLCLT